VILNKNNHESINEKEKEKIHLIFLIFFVFIAAFNTNLTHLGLPSPPEG
jgi:hypothetical protein